MKSIVTASGLTVSIKKFKEWWQVIVSQGKYVSYTAFQSKSKATAMSFMSQHYAFPTSVCNIGYQYVSASHVRVIRSISIYP